MATVYIGSGVTNIGVGAFIDSGQPNGSGLGIYYFLKVTLLSSVDIANLFYTDVTGVLFNKSHTKLAG